MQLGTPGARGAMGYSILSRSALACGHLLQSLSYTRWKPLSSQKRGFRPLSHDEPDLPALAPWGKAESHPIEGAEGQCLWWGLSPPEPFDTQTRHRSVFFAGAGVRTQGPCFSWAAERLEGPRAFSKFASILDPATHSTEITGHIRTCVYQGVLCRV